MAQPLIVPFDPSLARTRADRVALRRVVDPLGRVPHDPARVDAYRAAMLAGERFPPIAVVRVGPWYLVADGHKRLAAFATLNEPELVVDHWSWSDWSRDQWRQAGDHIRKHGRILRLTRTDPRGAFRLWTSTFSHWHRVARSLIGWRAAGR